MKIPLEGLKHSKTVLVGPTRCTAPKRRNDKIFERKGQQGTQKFEDALFAPPLAPPPFALTIGVGLPLPCHLHLQPPCSCTTTCSCTTLHLHRRLHLRHTTTCTCYTCTTTIYTCTCNTLVALAPAPPPLALAHIGVLHSTSAWLPEKKCNSKGKWR